MRSRYRILLIACLTALGILGTQANNIQVSGASLTPVGDGVSRVIFHITWENSWRTNNAPNNRDAAWIFVKYLNVGTGLWRHAYLGDGGHYTPLGVVDHLNGLEVPGLPFNATTNRGVGVFLHRFGNGTGTFDADGVELAWDHGASGVSYEDIDSVKVFAIEMVYVPQGAFTLGSGGTELGRFYTYPDSSSTYQVINENGIPVGPTNGYLYYPDTLSSDPNWHWGDQLGPVPDAFPKGFAPFYIMKHEVAQRDYVDFLNCLPRAQQANHTGTLSGTLLAPGVTSVSNRYVMSFNSSVINRQVIRCDAVIDADGPVTFYCDRDGDNVGNEAADGQWVACNYLHWLDLAAYLDWCGLRPMTELEFVKAARGAQQAPVPNEYVWGSTTITQAGTINSQWLIDEGCGTSGANAVYNSGIPGPMRTGVFAMSGTSRAQAGAGYYGALELSGNLGEEVVTMGVTLGRAFDGSLGDGELDSQGYADSPTWPGNSFLNGIGVIGGTWAAPSGDLRLSDRHTAAHVTGTARSGVNGGRGVRNAPVQ